MYNFRYHLITICSIFIALAVGLLLGAAIAGSDLVRDTSNDMVESLWSRFDEVEGTNTELQAQVDRNGPFTDELLNGWIQQRLDGRSIVILSDSATHSSGLGNTMSSLVKAAGGVPIVAVIDEPGLGLDDEGILADIQAVVAPVDGEDYTTTIGTTLAREWSTPVASSSELVDPADIPTDTGTTASAATASSTVINGPKGIIADDSFERSMYVRYPLTMELIDEGLLHFELDYEPMITRSTQAGGTLQPLVWQLLNTWRLPYATNGIINIAVVNNDAGQAMAADPTALAITSSYQVLGNTGKLHYPQFRTGATYFGTVTAPDTNQTSYFSVLAQDAGETNVMAQVAQQHSLPCITTPRDNMGRFGLIAMLSGGTPGTWGSNQQPSNLYPPLPADPTGNQPFK